MKTAIGWFHITTLTFSCTVMNLCMKLVERIAHIVCVTMEPSEANLIAFPSLRVQIKSIIVGRKSWAQYELIWQRKEKRSRQQQETFDWSLQSNNFIRMNPWRKFFPLQFLQSKLLRLGWVCWWRNLQRVRMHFPAVCRTLSRINLWRDSPQSSFRKNP